MILVVTVSQLKTSVPCEQTNSRKWKMKTWYVYIVAVNEREKKNLQQTTHKTPPPLNKMYTGFHNHILKKH